MTFFSLCIPNPAGWLGKSEAGADCLLHRRPHHLVSTPLVPAGSGGQTRHGAHKPF